MKILHSILLSIALVFFSPILVTATVSTGTSIPFRYSERKLETCARIVRNENDEVADSFDTCLKLYERFLEHYHRRDNISAPLIESPGYTHFITTAELVHQHNVRHSEHGFKLRLNQFADTSRSHTKPDFRNLSTRNQEDRSRDSWQLDLENLWEEKTDAMDNNNNNNNNYNHHRRQLRWNGMDVRLLDTRASITMEKEHQNEGFQRRLKWKSSHDGSPPLSSSTLRVATSSRHQTKVRMPGDGTNMPAAFSSPQVPPMIHGTEVELHKGGTADVAKGIDGDGGKSSLHKFSKFLDWSTSHNPDGVSLVHGVYDQGSCGSCWAFAATGSVEASAARNAARDYFVDGLTKINEEIKAINEDFDDDDFVDRHGYNTIIKDLAEESRTIESQTFEELNLSIQELLDCDTSVDEGCVGGNPSMAFYYIHKHGLVPWKEYPYVGYGGAEESGTEFLAMAPVREWEESMPFERSSLSTTDERSGASKYEPTCQKEKVVNPIATVESWGLLHKNHEALIEYALLYVGPVAVGINAADPSFISYGGGIFDSPDCDQTANHALLIVGYGEEDVTNQEGKKETVRYWIARNSWGKSWGEKGFVRVKRGSGGKGIPGVCGIARSPSVALGGAYRPNRMDPLERVNKGTTARYRKDKYVTSFDTSANLNTSRMNNQPRCDSMFSADRVHIYNGCVKNQPMMLALICFLCALLAIIPLAVSLLRQHRRALGNHSLFLDYYNDKGQNLVTHSERSRSSSASSSSSPGTLSERTHLLTLKDMYAEARKETKRPRGRSIVMVSPEHDPFDLVPSATFDSEDSQQNYGGVLTK